ncbi:MAG: ABC transporter substrate-binding protein [Gammaproteobacteria bacterium]|jgi:oligopeptide transport system substrate-binding protein|nr:ABC transporter substrate-binding protein [Gammaproteobacteria bacterium]MBT5222327.1 ABC transporter substrate-binding protein [Gammaproteobacteria bacterium]MBT5825970.1 ABC transporter substrate-binding protein [Gammaproteobacteria bacterium]MBT6576996.1 ABC transporter substrate-binding protein [Gammaproteobacteria bacterium]MBT7436320.1 ABC transporter substrate-binding protein [Gammaproteobacteria bacterium]
MSLCFISLVACNDGVLNNPYSAAAVENQAVLYSSFSERPKHLDPAKSYSSNEYVFIGQIYEPPFQYHYLKRPYELEPLTAAQMPEVIYLDSDENVLAKDAPAENIAYSDYIIDIKPGIKYQPHAALAKDAQGEYLHHQLTQAELSEITLLSDFTQTGTRELVAADYVHEIKRLVHPQISSPIGELMKQYIAGLGDYALVIKDKPRTALKDYEISGVEVVDKYRYKIRIKGKYPQFIYWLAMPFFAPMPWEADAFYSQQGLIDKNITLDWQPLGTGAFMLEENNPNLRMVMLKNPNYHAAFYPQEGAAGDQEQGLLDDAGKRLPFIDKAVYRLEKETIPYWNKFLQGYYDASGIASDSFDQAVQFTGDGELGLTSSMQEKGIQLQTAVTSSIFYMGFNMLDSIVGGDSERARKLRLAISIAIDYEEYISIFMNGRGVTAQDVIPPAIFGFNAGEQGINPYVYDWVGGQAQRKPLQAAKQLMAAAGYAEGVDKETGSALILYLDTAASGPDDRARLNWYRKQFAKLGIQLVIRATDYNRFQQKMLNGHAQIFMWGWNADYPDPENFFFLLYGANSKVLHGGENAVNYQNSDFDRLFKQMSNMENSPQRLAIVREMQEIIRHDAPWVYGFHPKSFSLFHNWYHNLKPNLMANNKLKYQRIEPQLREESRQQWNQPVLWPVIGIIVFLVLLILPAIRSFQRRARETIK